MTKDINIKAMISLTIAMLIWASTFIGLKAAMADLGPYTVIFLRMIFASACFLYFIKSFFKYEYTKKDIYNILLLGLFEPFLYFLFEAKALQYTSASQAGMIASLMPLITAVLAGYILKELISRKLIFGSILAMIGVVWLSLNSESTQNATNPLLGNFLELCAMTFGAGYTIVAKHLSYKFNAIFITAIQSFIGVILFFPFFIYELNTLEMNFTFNAIAWVAYLGIFATLGGYGLYNYAVTKIDASKVVVFVNLIPIFTLILAFIILGERFTSTQILASALILSGVYISQTTQKRRKLKAKS